MIVFRKSFGLFKHLKKTNAFCFNVAQKLNQVSSTQINENIPQLVRKPESVLLKNWWNETRFNFSNPEIH